MSKLFIRYSLLIINNEDLFLLFFQYFSIAQCLEMLLVNCKIVPLKEIFVPFQI